MSLTRLRWWRWSTDEANLKGQGTGIQGNKGSSGCCAARMPVASLARLRGCLRCSLVAGCRQDMQDQPKMIPQRGTEFFADHRGARPQVVNTVARGQLHEDSYFYTGVVQGANGYREEQNLMPFPVTMRSAEARRRAVQYLLHAVPFARWQRAGRDCRARLQAGRQSARPGADGAAAFALLLCHDAWLWGHARLLRAVDAGRSLGGCGVHSRFAVEPGGDPRGCAGGRRR